MHYRSLTAFTTVLLLIPCLKGFGQTEVKSEVNGGTIIEISSGNALIAPSYVHSNSFQGEITQFTGNGAQWTINFANPNFSINEFAETTQYATHYLEVLSVGTFQGTYFDIISNTTNRVVVQGINGESLPTGTAICIRKHYTIEDFFKNAEPSLVPGTVFLQFFYDNNVAVPLFWSGSFWTSDFSNNDNDLPIYPGQGFLGSFGQSYSFPVTGNVKTSPTVIPIYNNGINLIGSLSPVDLTFADLSPLDQMRQGKDIVVTYQDGPSLTITKVYFHGGDKFTSNFVTDEQSDSVPANQPFVVSAGSDFNWTLPSPIN